MEQPHNHKRGKMSTNSYYVKMDKRTLSTVFNGDLVAWSWYYSLKDYISRFKPDKYGYARISNRVILQDFGLDRFQFYRLNHKLVDLGLIAIDDVKRGQRVFSGIKILRIIQVKLQKLWRQLKKHTSLYLSNFTCGKLCKICGKHVEKYPIFCG